VDRVPSRAFLDTAETTLGRHAARLRAGHGDRSGFLMLSEGLDAFAARLVLARLAERGIDAQYYLLHDDQVGKLFLLELLEAADRGVRVRLLVDDIDLGGRDADAAALDTHPNIEVRVFNPFSRRGLRALQFLTRFGSVTRRMHNKSFTVDNQVTIVGGRNIGNEYFEADPELQFADMDVLAVGPVVPRVSEAFDAYWNSPLAYPIATLADPPSREAVRARSAALRAFGEAQRDSPYLQALRSSDLARAIRSGTVVFHWGEAQVLYDDPAKILRPTDEPDTHLTRELAPVLAEARRELIVVSPYFVPGRAGTEALARLARSGVRVRVLTNALSSTDVGVVHAGYAKYRKALLAAGVELYELDRRLSRTRRKAGGGVHGSSKASLHTKAFLVDGRRMFVGSFNFDPRSARENTEMGIVLTAPELVEALAARFDAEVERVAFRLERVDDGDDGYILWHAPDGSTYTAEPYVPFWRRFAVGLLGLLPIESQL
jgi:putative cardiolipin synthase